MVTVDIRLGDCLDLLRTLPADSVDAGVTDPPYELGFMGKKWDGSGIAFSPAMWAELLRVLKPGAHLVAFSGTRTYHRMVCAIEDAGFEIRDQLAWVFGSGFPKSSNQEGEWEGWGTALKPAWEPIVLARKPLIGNIPTNLATHRTGALNIDGCRVAHVTVGDGNLALNPHLRDSINGGNGGHIFSTETERRVGVPNQNGRWPANLCHDGSPEVVAQFPDEAGAAAPVMGTEPSSVTSGIYGKFNARLKGQFHSDVGSAARFFYCAKASVADREAGLEYEKLQALAYGNQALAEVKRGNLEHSGASGMNTVKMRANIHPTVKPTDLMRWLCRLITPPGGTIIDPFLGSGSTGRAAVIENFNFIGFEKDETYMPIAKARIADAQGPLFALSST